MKKQILAVGAIVLAMGALVSCGGKKDKTDTIVESTSEMELVENTDVVYDTIFKYKPEFYADQKNAGNGQDSTYKQTPTGLKYAVVKKGTGVSPKATDTVTVNYVGMLTNGQVFDSSVQRGEPATFPLNQVIPGWTEGLQTMQVGGVTEFYLPDSLAYGANGTPDGSIPPGAPLIFYVELLDVAPAK